MTTERDARDRDPGAVSAAFRHGRQLAFWSLLWSVATIILMFAVVGGSQAMRSAWVEDCLGLLPPALFLVAERLERRAATARFPYGFHRFGSLGFFAAACALLAMGALLLGEAVVTLMTGEHPTIGSVRWFGREVWFGWPMLGVLFGVSIAPVLLGRWKLRPASLLADKILHTDAAMNVADWQTGAAGCAGLVGIALGYWWADALAAIVISLGIVLDGLRNLRIAFAELIDGAPRALERDELHDDAKRLIAAVLRRTPGAHIRLRETGRYMRGIIEHADSGIDYERAARSAMRQPWRLLALVVDLRRPEA